MKRSLWLSLVVLAACSSRSGEASSSVTPLYAPPPSGYGVFRIYEPVPNTRPPVTIQGTIQVRPDTLIADVTPGPCRPQESGPQAYLVNCQELRLWFDRRDPINRNSFSLRTMAFVTERKCVEYAKDQDGRTANRCINYETEHIERPVSVSGRLRPQKP